MLVLLDDRTWTSGDDTAKFVEHIHQAMRAGVHVNCIHEFPSVVGPPRHECEFGLMFGDDWTPSHLTGGPTNLYKEIAFALKGVEWRQPGLVAVASKLAGSAAPHKPINFEVPDTYKPKAGPNKWKTPGMADKVENLIKLFDTDRDYIVSSDELHELLKKSDPHITDLQSQEIFLELLKNYDTNGDDQLSVDEVAAWTVATGRSLAPAAVDEADAKPLPTDTSHGSIEATKLHSDDQGSDENASGPVGAQPLQAQSEMFCNARGSLMMEQESTTFLVVSPASALPVTEQSDAPATNLSDRLKSMLFSTEQVQKASETEQNTLSA